MSPSVDEQMARVATSSSFFFAPRPGPNASNLEVGTPPRAHLQKRPAGTSAKEQITIVINQLIPLLTGGNISHAFSRDDATGVASVRLDTSSPWHCIK